jgi:hypothetical protein
MAGTGPAMTEFDCGVAQSDNLMCIKLATLPVCEACQKLL